MLLLLVIVFTTHFLTCFWFMVGDMDDGESDGYIGWVMRETVGMGQVIGAIFKMQPEVIRAIHAEGSLYLRR